MRQVFGITRPFRIPDGTLVAPFLNPRDSKSGLPFALLDGVSLSAGTIEPRSASKITIMPHVTQITFVRRGNLEVYMKGPADAQRYSLALSADQAVITEPGTYLQLVNDSDQPCEVLYIVTPAYVYEESNRKEVLYDDSVVAEESWEALEAAGWRTAARLPGAEEREAAVKRLAEKASRTAT
jgi:hypothetical protein